MIYQYRCDVCKKDIDIIKDSSDHRRDEYCGSCSSLLNRIFNAPSLKVTKSTWPEFNPAFGKVMSKDEVNYEVKKQNLIEVGSEDLNKIDIKLEKEQETKRAESWDNLVHEVYKET